MVERTDAPAWHYQVVAQELEGEVKNSKAPWIGALIGVGIGWFAGSIISKEFFGNSIPGQVVADLLIVAAGGFLGKIAGKATREQIGLSMKSFQQSLNRNRLSEFYKKESSVKMCSPEVKQKQ